MGNLEEIREKFNYLISQSCGTIHSHLLVGQGFIKALDHLTV